MKSLWSRQYSLRMGCFVNSRKYPLKKRDISCNIMLKKGMCAGMKRQDKRVDLGSRQRMLRYISKEKEVSRSEIAKNLSLSMPTVLAVTKELLSENIIEEVGVFESTGGRKAKKLTLAGDRGYSAGIDITVNHISMVVVNLRGEIVEKVRLRMRFQNSLEYFEQLVKKLDDFLEDSCVKDRDKILGVGISFPGIIDREKEMLIRSHALDVEGVSLKNVSQMFRWPVLYENDANSAALAELRNTNNNAVYLSLSNTVGGAIFLNGRIYEGNAYHSAEFGHMLLKINGRKCYCGRIGCVDAYCSAKVLSDMSEGSLERFFQGLEEKNAAFLKLWDEYLEDLALTVNNLRIIFDCDVILGGYVGGFMEKYMGDLRKRVLKYCMFDQDVTFLRDCRIKYEASAVGTAMKFIDQYIESV